MLAKKDQDCVHSEKFYHGVVGALELQKGTDPVCTQALLL